MPLQLDFFIAPVTRAAKAPSVKRVAVTGSGKLQMPAPQGLTVAEMLNRGIKVAFPKDANAIRIALGTKTTVILKADADTLTGAGVATAVEFGAVRNDAKGHPVRKNFEPLAAVNDANRSEGALMLSL